MDNARERHFGNGKEPRVLWKIHAAFIANLLHSGGGSEGKDRGSTRGSATLTYWYAVITVCVRGNVLGGSFTPVKVCFSYISHKGLLGTAGDRWGPLGTAGDGWGRLEMLGTAGDRHL